MTQSPLSVLNPMGPAAQQISPLLWGLLWVSVVVAALIAGAVVGGVIARRARGHDPAKAGVVNSPGGVKWVYVATGVSTAILMGFTGWTLVTMAQSAPRTPPALTIDVSARQWWWSFGYEPAAGAAGFVTANEIHIPVGRPVRFLLTSPDVIHSFWVPALGGKTDVIPGRTNETWLEADKPGIYRGQCAEYCGVEHAEMALFVVAEPEAEFEAWRRQAGRAGERNGAPRLFVARCGGVPHRAWHASGGHEGPGPHASDEPQHDRRGDARQYDRQSRRLGGQSTGAQARGENAQRRPVGARPPGRADLSRDPELRSL